MFRESQLLPNCSLLSSRNCSKTCWNETLEGCDSSPVPTVLYKFAETWLGTLSLIGTSGNLLTLTAIVWARWHNALDVERNWKHYTVFVLNLALADLLYCIIVLPIYSDQFKNIHLGDPPSDATCRVTVGLEYLLSYICWMSLGVIAANRCIALTNPTVSRVIHEGKRYYWMILGVWIYGFAMATPVVVNSGSYGYNNKTGMCDYLCDTDDVSATVLKTAIWFVGFSLPLYIMVISYFIIWKTVRRSSSFLKENSSSEVREMLEHRDYKLTRMILTLCICYFFTTFPYCSFYMLNLSTDLPCYGLLHFVSALLYWVQYTLNIFIYAASSEECRRKYCLFIKHGIFSCIFGPLEDTSTSSCFQFSTTFMQKNKDIIQVFVINKPNVKSHDLFHSSEIILKKISNK